MAKSSDLWTRRIAIIATLTMIRSHNYVPTLKIARILRNDEHDLIHKAVGWMLRETGKRDLETEERFLRTHYAKMPRTMLRYTIEQFPKQKRQAYLAGEI
jgi:3-methyladenine DNA glycosylase AlkD